MSLGSECPHNHEKEAKNAAEQADFELFSNAVWDCYVEKLVAETLRQVLFDVRAGNSDLAKSLSEKSNHAMYQDENLHRGLLSLENYQN